MLKEFKAFILKGNVVDLAVAVVIGAAFGKVVTSLVENMLTPLVAIPGSTDFSQLKFTINDSKFMYGVFVNDIVSFVMIAAAIFFFVVKPMNMVIARRNKGEDVDPDPTTKECHECMSIIPIAAKRCMYCTSEVAA